MTTLQSIIKKAHNSLPADKRARPWSFLNRGINLLKTEEELNCYLSAYGTMHEAKIIAALDELKERQDIFKSNVRLIDWGCGQGLATICYLDFLKSIENSKYPNSITLIEPSESALTKANLYVEEAISNTKTKIKTLNKFLDDVENEDIKTNSPITIHFFSNILDIESVNLQELAEIIKTNLIGKQYFICVGPLYHGSTRIDEFAKLLNIPEEEILARQDGNLNKVRGTIKLLVFKIEGQEIEVIKTKYYPPMSNTKNYTHILGKLLDKVNPIDLSDIDRIIEYYKTAVELEQLKEPKIEEYFNYNLILSDDHEITIDLEENEVFLKKLNTNRNTQWPKDLAISIILESDTKQYPLLNFTYLFEDIKTINPSEENLTVKLTDFELNYSELSKLNLDSEKINSIEKALKKLHSIKDIVNIFSSEIEETFEFDDNIKLALTTKNPSLLQTYAELRKLKSNIFDEESLLSQFLCNSTFNNAIDEFDENNLVHITQLDPSQKKAVSSAFNNKLTVITGPPGTGKTQVITNILANAVLLGKKVLVASKNNKAVDNVKSRFDKEDESGFFLRFGKKNILIETTKPEISRIKEFKGDLTNNYQELDANIEKLNSTKNLKKSCEEKLEKIDTLNASLLKISEEKKNLEVLLDSFKNDNSIFEKLRLQYKIDKIEHYISQLKSARNEINLKYFGLKKLWFNWFLKRNYTIALFNIFENYTREIRDYVVSRNFSTNLEDYAKGDKIIAAYNDLIESFETLVSYSERYKKKVLEVKRLSDQIKKDQKLLNELINKKDDFKQTISECNIKIIDESKLVLKSKIKNKLFHSETAYINNYTNYIPDDIPWKDKEVQIFIDSTIAFLEIFNIISVTSLSAKASLPLTENLFDMVVIDEASQCDIASALPLILRAKQLVVIGDPMQLKHICSLNEHEDTTIKERLNLTKFPFLNYKNKSLWDYSEEFLAQADNNNKKINLLYHYRSHKDIIGYSNEQFYIRNLNTILKIETKEENFTIEPKGVKWVDIVGQQQQASININNLEAQKCAEIAINQKNLNPEASIGIVTPFRHQAKEIFNLMPDILKEEIIVDTAHKFQGDEKDIMIYSLVVTNNSPDTKIYWIDKMVPELVNVAVTRAKNTLYIVGNKEYIRSKSSPTKPLGKLVEYVETVNN